MPIYVRRIIFAVFVGIFIISAGAILFYGSGYRWNGLKNKIEKTGQLSLDSKPKGAEVYVNGELLRGTWKFLFHSSSNRTTPLHIKNLLPGEYSIEIKKEGYYSWKKNVRIVSGQTALFHGIRLLKNSAPQKMIDGDIIQFSMLSNTMLVALTKNDFFLVDMQKKTVQTLFHSDRDECLSFTARADGGQFFLRLKGTQFILDTNGARSEIGGDKAHTILSVRWSNTDDIFGKTKDGIVSISLAPLVFKKITHGSVDDFFIHDERLFTIEGEKKKFVNIRELKHFGQPPIEVLSLPLPGGHFLDTKSQDIAIQKKSGGIVVLSPVYGKNAFNILELESITQLSEKKYGVFLGWNDVELWKYKLSGQEYGKTLITRQSTPLQKAFYSNIVPAVFFLSNNGVTMIDMADNSNGNQMQLFGLERVFDVALSEDEKEFFISGTLNGVSGLYRFQMID